LVRVGAYRGDEVLVLADRRTGSLSYTLLDAVTAVELHNPQLFRDILTEGRLPLETATPVSRLALRREFAPTPEFPVQVDWEAMAGSERLVGNLSRLLGGLRDVVDRVRVDEIGRHAWDQVRSLRVEHHAGIGVSVERVGDGLSVSADLDAALPRTLTDELYREINALL
jgi:hypothetical protein